MTMKSDRKIMKSRLPSVLRLASASSCSGPRNWPDERAISSSAWLETSSEIDLQAELGSSRSW